MKPEQNTFIIFSFGNIKQVPKVTMYDFPEK